MIDPELAAIIEVLPKMDLVDPVAARRAFEEILVAIKIDIPGVETLDIEDRMVPGWESDPDVPVRVYRPARAAAAAHASAAARAPGILMIHGGGFVIGSVEAEHAGAALTAMGTGAAVVSVDYRLAPEHPFPAGLHDCYAALCFLHAEADALGVDPGRVALTGASAGGGLAAATALLARDRGGPSVCFQLLQIPELDDRLQTASMQTFVDSPMWNRPLAVQSWQAYLGPLYGSADVPAYAAPARADDLSELPPAYISTAENDPLRDEGITYAQRLLQAGVSVELHQFPGTFHGSALVTSAAISKRAQRESALVLRQALGVGAD
jgi:acetyl esterase/lipase